MGGQAIRDRRPATIEQVPLLNNAKTARQIMMDIAERKNKAMSKVTIMFCCFILSLVDGLCLFGSGAAASIAICRGGSLDQGKRDAYRAVLEAR